MGYRNIFMSGLTPEKENQEYRLLIKLQNMIKHMQILIA